MEYDEVEIPHPWEQRVSASISREKREVEERYQIKIGQTSITCAVCGKPWGFGHRECNPGPERFIPLDVDREKWIDCIRGLRDEYGISEGTKQDSSSAKRIALLVGELYLSNYQELRTGKGTRHNAPLLNVMIVEREIYAMAIENRLTCDPLEKELKVKDPKHREGVLDVWGVDKKSGFENYRTQLAEWTAEALLVEATIQGKEETKGVEFRLTPSGHDYRSGIDAALRHEEERVELFKGRKRDAFREVEQDEAGLS